MKFLKKWIFTLVLITLIAQWGTLSHTHAHLRKDIDTCHICHIQHHLGHHVTASDPPSLAQTIVSTTTTEPPSQNDIICTSTTSFLSRAPPFFI